MLRKSQSHFQHYVKKIEAPKKWFYYERTCTSQISKYNRTINVTSNQNEDF